jgi:pentatricopeptide repeat protein
MRSLTTKSMPVAHSSAAVAPPGPHPLALPRLLYLRLQAAELAPDAHTYTSLISGCAYGRQAGLARELLRHMQRRGVQPTLWTHNAMLKVRRWGRRGAGGQQLGCMCLAGLGPAVISGCLPAHWPHRDHHPLTACLPACLPCLQVECWTYGVDAGVVMMRGMQARGVQPDRASWSTLLSGEQHSVDRCIAYKPGASAWHTHSCCLPIDRVVPGL